MSAIETNAPMSLTEIEELLSGALLLGHSKRITLDEMITIMMRVARELTVARGFTREESMNFYNTCSERAYACLTAQTEETLNAAMFSLEKASVTH